MTYKSLILFVIALCLIGALYSMPAYHEWLEKKIFTTCDIPGQLERMDLEDRRISRYGYSYVVFKDVASKLGALGNVTVLLPPDKYLLEHKVTEVKMVEPAVFYYFTGLNSVYVRSPNVLTANWAIVSSAPGQVALTKIHNRKQLDSLITIFKPYQP